MNFRRLPFQFSATDPAARQRELEKRFGLPSQQKMYVDVGNPLISSTLPKETCSPRLQHRVPIFAEGYDYPLNSSVDSMGSQLENKKPNVRIIPIEVEGAERPVRHRTFSGPAGVSLEENLASQKDEPSPLKHSIGDLSKPFIIKPNLGPRVYNIPIQTEGESNSSRISTKTNKTLKSESPKVNGCSISKSVNKVESTQNVQPETNKKQKDKERNSVENSLKKIGDVLAEFKKYVTLVNEFNGTSNDKQYKYLDEMLTRCMLQLDDVDTMGNENVRLARKNAVKKVQASIDLLERKSNEDLLSTVENEQTPEMSAPEESKSLKVYGIEVTDVEMKENEDTNEVNRNVTVLNDDSNECIEMQEVNKAVDETATSENIDSNCKSECQKITGIIEQSEVKKQDEQIRCVTSSSDIINECQTNVTEMLDKNYCNSELTEVEASLPSHDATNLEKIEDVCENNMCHYETEKQKEVPEVEMVEIQVSSPVDLTLKNELNEVEIGNSDRNIVGNVSESISCNTTKDVEMEDHSNDLNVTTVNVDAEETNQFSSQSNQQNIPECDSSHCKENKTDTNVKAQISSGDSGETNIGVSEHSTVTK